MGRRLLVAGVVACNFALAACATLPALEEATGGIPVYEIVLRTKCELSAAFQDDAGRWLPDYEKFAWLQNWTAQADLTLQILDQATFSPGLSVTEPLHNAYPTSVGPSSVSTSGVPGATISGVSQSFAVAAGANLNGQAQRTETLSFTFSVAELKDWRSNPNMAHLCAISDNMDLRGRLGLKEWLRQALGPVVGEPELLYAGYHPKPGSASASLQKTTQPKSLTTQFLEQKGIAPEAVQSCTVEDLDKLLDQLTGADDALTGAAEIAKNAKVSFAVASSNAESEVQVMKKARATIEANKSRFSGVLDPAIRRKADYNSTNLKLASRLGDEANNNIDEAKKELEKLEPLPGTDFTAAKNFIRDTKTRIERAKRDIDHCNLSPFKRDAGLAQTRALDALNLANAATKNIASANTNIKNMKSYVDTATEFTSQTIDPPVATIGQSVQFILTYGGNVTPTWTFVRFKGPNSPLLSTSGTRTHTLNITLGPVNPATNAPNADVKQNQFYLQLNSVFGPSLR